MSHRAATDPPIAISPALADMAEGQAPPALALIDIRAVKVIVLSVLLGIFAAGAAQLLERLIYLITNLAFYGRLSIAHASPVDNTLGWWVVAVPVVGALLVGVMARFGSPAIRGHGIPEAMEQVLTNRSRIPARITILKPLSAALSIGTGGPFGAEGPIIATGGALGSLVGQVLSMTAQERKTLLAAGAAAGMAATFGSPVSAVLLAVELLLFELRPRSVIAVALAATTATGLRMAIVGTEPAFHMPDVAPASLGALVCYVILGALVGLAASVVTRSIYAIEDAFEKLPIHWMWWPALGALAVGFVGYFEPRTLGVGYQNISDLISGNLALGAVVALCSLKFVSWSISLGSGTSGGTLAPLMTVGGGMGATIGMLAVGAMPWLGVDPRVCAVVGMAAMFAGASRAFLASAVFAFETTLQQECLLPLLGGCAASYLCSCLIMRNSIMTEKIARRGVSPPAEYTADVLDQVLVREVATKNVVTLKQSMQLAEVRSWLHTGGADAAHQGFPVVDDRGILVGVVTRRLLLNSDTPETTALRDLLRMPVKFTYDDCTVRQATDHLVNHDIGRLPVVSRRDPTQIVGILTRSDILSAYRRRIDEMKHAEPGMFRRPAKA
jgi:H+/Cl- antiporter ClcA/predicted transcriptional regulator